MVVLTKWFIIKFPGTKLFLLDSDSVYPQWICDTFYVLNAAVK